MYSCVISTMCTANLEYKYINPSTQVALYSDCVGLCTSSIKQINWRIYEGANDSSIGIVQWKLFNAESPYFYGKENILRNENFYFISFQEYIQLISLH